MPHGTASAWAKESASESDALVWRPPHARQDLVQGCARTSPICVSGEAATHSTGCLAQERRASVCRPPINPPGERRSTRRAVCIPDFPPSPLPGAFAPGSSGYRVSLLAFRRIHIESAPRQQSGKGRSPNRSKVAAPIAPAHEARCMCRRRLRGMWPARTVRVRALLSTARRGSSSWRASAPISAPMEAGDRG